jgi:hypothetical protein
MVTDIKEVKLQFQETKLEKKKMMDENNELVENIKRINNENTKK